MQTSLLLCKTVSERLCARDVAMHGKDEFIVAYESGVVCVWSFRWYPTVLQEMNGHTASANAVVITPDGTRAVTGSSDCTVRVWRIKDGAELRRWDVHGEKVYAVALTPDGTRVITGSSNNAVRVWDLGTGAELFQMGDPRVVLLWSGGIHASETKMVAASASWSTTIWELGTGAYLDSHFVGWLVYSVAITSDGKRIVTGSFDKMARVLDAITGHELLRIPHPDKVLHVAVSGNKLVTCCADNTTRIWDLDTGQFLMDLFVGTPTLSARTLKFNKDGTRLVAWDGNRGVFVWSVTMAEDAVVAFCGGYPGEAVVHEVVRFLT